MAAGDVTPGRRRDADVDIFDLEAGDYSLRSVTVEGVSMPAVYCVLPDDSGFRMIYKLWDITENEDGTVTVSPSIQDHPSSETPGWHGYLENGVWREV